MLAIQTFLQSGGTPDQLLDRYAIKASRHSVHPNLILFKYNQISSPMGEKICQEARGIILDEADNWRVVGRGFDKFFNYGEGHAPEIDWCTARVQEKVDGSLLMTYLYAGMVWVATTGTPDASGAVFGCNFTFAELFWSTLGTNARILQDTDMRDACFLFELTSPYNRVVVRHAGCGLTLLAIRNRITGTCYPHEVVEEYAQRLHVPVVRQFPLTCVQDIVASFASMDPLRQEGYVVVDGNGNRIKVKHPGYVALHHLKEGIGPKWMVEIVRSGETSEVLVAFPEFRVDMESIQETYHRILQEINTLWEATRHASLQKEFALAVKDSPYSGALFALRAGKVRTAQEWLAQIPLQSAMRLLGVKDSPQTDEVASP